MTEQLPPNWGEYIADQMMYWVDNSKPGGESTWKHPLYDKYNLMLKVLAWQHFDNDFVGFFLRKAIDFLTL